jgi:hypothetical protein
VKARSILETVRAEIRSVRWICANEKLKPDLNHVQLRLGALARDVMGQVLSSAGGGRPKSPDRCPCGKMTVARAEKRGHKC